MILVANPVSAGRFAGVVQGCTTPRPTTPRPKTPHPKTQCGVKRRSSGAFFLLLLPLLVACSEPQREVVLQGPTMGTTYSVKYLSSNQSQSDSNEQAVAKLLAYLDATLSTYQYDSELNRLNRVPVGEDFAVSALLWQLLLISERVFEQTGGAFDPTVGPLVDLWGFGPQDTDDRVPSHLEITSLLGKVGYQHLVFLPTSRSVRKQADIRVDLSAIAKGFAAEQVAAMLAEQGIENYLVEVGGEICAAGVNASGEHWRVAIEAPVLARGQVQKVIALSDHGIATSGDYRNYFERDGQRYSHTIDPRTGYPISHTLASVTVVADDAAEADALATAYMVLGAEQALAMARRDKVAAYFLVRNDTGFVEQSSETFAEQFQ